MELLAVAAALIVLALFVLRGAPELARLEVRKGELTFEKGRLPPRLLEDFGDVLSRASIARATVRIVLDGGAPRVVARGLTEDQLQQLRNVAGAYPVAAFRAGRRPRR